MEFDGKAFEPTARRLKALRREIGIVFQSYNLFPHLCVERNITLGPTAAKGIKLAAARELARKVLRMVDLEDKIAAYPQQLSGGQQQRVAIARALAMEPGVIFTACRFRSSAGTGSKSHDDRGWDQHHRSPASSLGSNAQELPRHRIDLGEICRDLLIA